MAATIEELRALFEDVARRFQETDRKFQESDRKFQETVKESDRKFQESIRESDRKFQESREEAERRSQDLERLARDTDRQLRDTDRQLKQLGKQIGELGNRLGEFVEGLVKPAVVRLFQERGIEVHEVHTEVSASRHGEATEIDLLVVNDDEVVLVEVKSKLKQADVDEHLERLEKFKRLLPRYADTRALGTVAAMVVPEDTARYAYRQGLFVLAQTGENVVILNDTKFQPKAW